MLSILAGTTSPPTTKRGTIAEQYHGRYAGLVTPIKAGEYWRVYPEPDTYWFQLITGNFVKVTASILYVTIKKMDIN